MMTDVLVVIDASTRSLSVTDAVRGLDGIVNERWQDGVIDCSLPAENVSALRSVPGVRFVRPVQSYSCWASRN